MQSCWSLSHMFRLQIADKLTNLHSHSGPRNKQRNSFSITCCHVNALTVTWHFWFVQRTQSVMVLRWQIDLCASWMQIYCFHFLTRITMEAEALKAKALHYSRLSILIETCYHRVCRSMALLIPTNLCQCAWKSNISGKSEFVIIIFILRNSSFNGRTAADFPKSVYLVSENLALNISQQWPVFSTTEQWK